MTPFEAIPLDVKLWLVRKLLEERTKQGLFGRLFLNVQKMDDAVVMGTPEGTIVTIVDAYHLLRGRGASATEAFGMIENHRSMLISRKMPNSADLYEYIKYRIRLEHKRGRQISDFEIRRASSMTSEFIEKFFGPGPVQGEPKGEDAESQPKRPSDYELYSRVASTIDSFIEANGVSEFASDRLHVVINQEYHISISAASFVRNALVSVPLSDLNLELAAVRQGGDMRHIAVDMAARRVTAQLGS